MTFTVSWWSINGYHRREGLGLTEVEALVLDLMGEGILPITGVSNAT